MTLCPSGGDPPHSLHCHYSSFNTYMRRFRRFCSGSLALASLDLPAGIIVPTSPRRSPPRLLPQQLAVAWDQRPDRRTRRALLHLSYSSAPPFGSVMLVTQSPARPRGRRYAITFARRAHDAKPPEIYVLPTESDTYKRVRDPRSILITGASSGIGAALARAYAAPRTRLAICGRDTARLATVANLCRERGAEVIETCLDVTEAPAVAAWIDTADRASPLELVIANAGVQGGLWRDGCGETLDELHRVMDVNFGGVSNTIYPVLPAMRRRRRGQIALIASLAALRGLPYSPGYCASKAAVRIYGEALRSWLAPEGIDVSVVLPGFVETRLSG